MELKNYSTNQIGSCLKKRRIILGLTNDDVVKKLEMEQGITMAGSTLYKYENGKINPTLTAFISLCNLYGVYDIRGFLESTIEDTTAINALDSPNKEFITLQEGIQKLNQYGITELKNFLDTITCEEAFTVKDSEENSFN